MIAPLSPLKSLFSFPFRGTDWQNRFIIGSALILAGWFFPIVPVLFVYGYVLEVMRRTIQGEEPHLPPWQDWGRLIVDGLRGSVVGLVYLLPGNLVYFGGIGLYFVGVIGLTPSMERESWAIGLFFLILAIFMVALFLGSLLIFLGLIPLPMATAHFVAEDRLASAFHIRRWWAVLKNRGWEYFIAWIILMGLAGFIYFALMLLYYLPCLCWLIPVALSPLAFYLMLMAAAIFGQVYGGRAGSQE